MQYIQILQSQHVINIRSWDIHTFQVAATGGTAHLSTKIWADAESALAESLYEYQ